MVGFVGYYVFLDHLQLACHELTTIQQKKVTKTEIPKPKIHHSLKCLFDDRDLLFSRRDFTSAIRHVRKLPVTWGYRWWFYRVLSGFLHHLQLTALSHELAAIWQKK